MNIDVNLSSSEFYVNITFNVYNSTGTLVQTQGPSKVNDSLELPLTFTISSSLSDGIYIINMTVADLVNNENIKKEGFSADSSQITGSFDNNLRSEALSALVMLGIKRSVAQKSIETVLRNSENNITLELLIKLSLQAS